MKQSLVILTALLIPATLFAFTSPGRPTGFVNDFVGVLSSQDKQDIETKLVSLNRTAGAQVAVAIVPTVGADETIETYAAKLFQEWGIGDEDKDRGLLLVVAIDDRRMRIEVGYGLEGSVTDVQSGNIIRNVLTPAFKEGKYAAGISSAVDALSAIIAGSPDVAQYSQDASGQSSNGFGLNPAAIIFVVVIILNALARLLGKTKSWWLGGVIGAVIGTVIGLIWGFVSVGIIATIILTILGLLFDFIVSKRPPGSGDGGFWPMFFGGGHHGGGGGFGGFGGGMSGGGGASGRW